MTDQPVTLIVARAINGVIGRDGTLPWHISADLKRFKRLTMGSVMIMGRRTFDSLPGVLPGRRHIVLTRDRDWQAQGVEVAHDVAEAMAMSGSEPVSVIGGAEVFDMFLPMATRIELTEVLLDADGDTRMADPRALGEWSETLVEEQPAEGDTPAYRFVTLERI